MTKTAHLHTRIAIGFMLFAIFPSNSYAQSWSRVLKQISSDRSSFDHYGYAVSMDGDWAAVGAYQEDLDENGQISVGNAGAVHILHRDNSGTWTEVQKVVASDRASSDRFGKSVCVRGNMMIIGAPSKNVPTSAGSGLYCAAGAAYIFEKDTSGVWVEIQKIHSDTSATNDNFGTSVSISGDFAVVGAWGEDEDENEQNFMSLAGAAYFFQRTSPSTWALTDKMVPQYRRPVDRFGCSVSIHGDYAVVGVMGGDLDSLGLNYKEDAGSAIVYKRSSGQWSEYTWLLAPDRDFDDCFGYSVSLYDSTILIGAYRERNFDLSSGGGSMPKAGSAYFFDLDGTGTWNFQQKIVPSDRHAYDEFGSSVCVWGDLAIVGAPLQDSDESGFNNASNAGAAYIFKLDSTQTWVEWEKIAAPDRESADKFGEAVAISGFSALTGVYRESHDLSGANYMEESGSAYIHEVCNITTSNLSVTECGSYTSPSGSHVYSSSGIYLDTLLNSTLCDSIITIDLTIQQVPETDTVVWACNSFEWYGNTYTSTGFYTKVFPNSSNGCDSIINLYLTVEHVNTGIISWGNTLIADLPGATYQWLDCDQGLAPIPSATTDTLHALSSGNYAMVITDHVGCIDTSDCVSVSYVGLQQSQGLAHTQPYPNPSNGRWSYHIPPSHLPWRYNIIDSRGRILVSDWAQNNSILQINLTRFEPGTYFLELSDDNQVIRHKLIKD